MIDIISKKLLDVSVALSAEKDDEVLLERILNVAMEITNCDAATIYIKNENVLNFRLMFTQSIGGKIDAGSMPPVEITSENVCSKAFIERKVYNIKNVYENSEFDFTGPKKYDKLTGYKTVSMLVVPMQTNSGDQIGVLQLINAMTEDKKTVPFTKEHEQYVTALTSQVAISLVKMNQAQEIKGLVDSLTKALSTAIYERTPYNVTHTANMVKYANRFLDWLDRTDNKHKFTPKDRNQFIMSVWLHDVGKLTVPLEVMNKESRLSTGIDKVLKRFEIIDLSARLMQAEKGIPYKPVKEKLEHAKKIIFKANIAPIIDEELEREIKQISNLTYEDLNGLKVNWLRDFEVDALCIKSGTLTSLERRKMENHVVMTKTILDQVKFGKEYDKVKKWASEHHEFLDGSGYPKRLKGDELCFETRLLTILDVMDGLSAKDRPYRKVIPIEKVIEILNDMALKNKIDKKILSLFIESKAWEENV